VVAVAPRPPATATGVAAAPVAAAPADAAPADANAGTEASATIRGITPLVATPADAAIRTAPVLALPDLAIAPVGEFTVASVPGMPATAAADSPALDLASALRERSLAQALAPLRRDEAAAQLTVSRVAIGGTAVSAGMSVGYVLWLARGGVLMASVLAALPAWASLDPLPVLGQVKAKGPARGPVGAAGDDDDDGDAVEQLFSKAPAQAATATSAEVGR